MMSPCAWRMPCARASSLLPLRQMITSRLAFGNAWRSIEARRFWRRASSLGPTGMTKESAYRPTDAIAVIDGHPLVASDVEPSLVDEVGMRIGLLDVADDLLHDRLVRYRHHVPRLDAVVGEMHHELVSHVLLAEDRK